MAKKQKNLPTLSNHNPLVPIDITQLGTNGDPCFGKGYDLTTKECKLCGDSELCAFKMAQELRITREELEAKNKYKDLDILEDVDAIKKYMRSLKRKGISKKDIISKSIEKFEVPKNTIRELYKELKK